MVTKKAALLIGINYGNSDCQLRGCENDIHDLKNILINVFNFEPDNILVLLETLGGDKVPTQNNILKAIDWLIEKNNQGFDNLWFQYSGHGTHVQDQNGDEIDGQDEAIVTSDLKLITDDVLFERLVNRVKEGTKMMAIMDCCHSGSILDLHYKYCGNSASQNTNPRCTSKADIVALSGCSDQQTSADAVFNNKWNGALTKNLVKILSESNFNVSCNGLMINVINQLRSTGFTQFPEMSSTLPLTAASQFCCKNYNGDSSTRPYLC